MKMAERVTAQLLAHAARAHAISAPTSIRRVAMQESGKDTIHDMIRFVGAKVEMIGTGWVAPAGAHIFLGAKRENRFCLLFTCFRCTSLGRGVQGRASDITAIEAEEISQECAARLIREIALETVASILFYIGHLKEAERNFWMGAAAVP